MATATHGGENDGYNDDDDDDDDDATTSDICE